jgi:16S rRNA (cytosine1402-N4)-methyltransferase
MSNAQSHGAGQLALPGLASESSAEWVWSEEIDDPMEPASFVHETIMRGEVVAALAVGIGQAEGGVYVDATVGGGGHSEGILEANPTVRVIAFDRDEVALAAARERLAKFGERVTFVKTPFGDVKEALSSLGLGQVDGLCADLGVSSPQLDEAGRGMSFRREGPIDMRMDRSEGETALELIERVSDDELADIIFHYGDERRSRRIARSVKRALADNQLGSTLDLRRAIVRAVGPVRVGGVDPATRTFQALRIAVNGELEQLEGLLAELPHVIRFGGRVAILSFHSLEDRLVKRAFQDRETWELVSKKPLTVSDEEGNANPRARSAKLRGAIRIDISADPRSAMRRGGGGAGR